jgi:hypothetical protein
LYSLYGDVFAKICLVLSAIFALTAFIRKKQTERGKVYV